MNRGAIVGIVVSGLLYGVGPGFASGESARRTAVGPTYQLEWAVDLPMVLIPAFVSLGWALSAETGAAHCAPRCDRADVNAFDRVAAGNFSRGWTVASDATLFVGIASAAGWVLADEGLSAGLNDMVVGLEVMLMTGATAVVLNLATRRPRPLLYSTDAPLDERNSPKAALSFFSGHAGLTASVSTWAFVTTYRRNPGRALPWIVLASGALLTATVATGRVAAGRHFPTDVIAGTVIGASYGLLIPELHRSPVQVLPSVGPGGVGATARVSF